MSEYLEDLEARIRRDYWEWNDCEKCERTFYDLKKDGDDVCSWSDLQGNYEECFFNEDGCPLPESECPIKQEIRKEQSDYSYEDPDEEFSDNSELLEEGLCPWCANPMVMLMIDCPICGKPY